MTNDDEMCWMFFAGMAIPAVAPASSDLARLTERAGKVADLMMQEMRRRRSTSTRSESGATNG